MKILFVNNFRGRGGGEEFLRDLLPGLIARGVKIGLICRPGTPLVEMFKNTAIELHPINRSGLHGISALFKTARVIQEQGYDAINIQRGHDIVQSWFGGRLSGRKPVLLYTVQVPEFIRSRFLLSRMRNIVTISRHIRDRIIDFFPGVASKVSIIYYGIDLDKFKPELVPAGSLRQRFNLSPKARIIGTVGDLWKNQIEFLDALVLIKKEVPGALFALAGSVSDNGPARVFKDRAAQLRLTDSILWVGRLAKEDMYSFYADIDMAVCTHRKEGFGIWILEALSMGTPVIAFDAGGVRDSLEGCPAGKLVSGTKDMADEIIKVLTNEALLQRMSDAGPQWTRERFSRERMVEDYYNFFSSIMAKKG